MSSPKWLLFGVSNAVGVKRWLGLILFQILPPNSCGYWLWPLPRTLARWIFPKKTIFQTITVYNDLSKFRKWPTERARTQIGSPYPPLYVDTIFWGPFKTNTWTSHTQGVLWIYHLWFMGNFQHSTLGSCYTATNCQAKAFNRHNL